MEVLIGYLLKLIYFLLVIGFVAFIHELGHFLVAKWCNVRVDAFAIGMGTQKLWARTIGETEYSVRIFPIGGFVLLAHEDGVDTGDGRPDPGERSFQRKKIWQKIAILLAGPFMNVLGTIGIITLLLFHFGVNSSTIHVIKLMPNSPAEKAGIQADDVFISINGQKILRTEDGQRIIRESNDKVLQIKVARRSNYKEFTDYGTLKNFLEKDYVEGNFIRIHQSNRKFPVVFDNRSNANNFLKSINKEQLDVDVSSKVDALDVQVKPDSTGKIGVHITPYFLDDRLMTYPFMESLEKATTFTIQMTKILFMQITDIVINIATKFKAPDGIGGPVAIANAVSQTVDKGLHSFFELAAQICLSIGVFNLIPIPGLDGGRIFVIVTKELVNWLSRRVFGRAKEAFDDVMEGYINIFGVLCVLSLIVIVTYQDIQAVMR